MLALRAHPGAYVPRALPAHEDAADDVRRDGVRGLPVRTQVHQAVGKHQQDIRERGTLRDIRERLVCLRRVHRHVP